MNILIHDPVKLADEFKQTYDLIKAEIQKVVIGQEDIIDLLLISLFSRGHCVLVGVPGLALSLIHISEPTRLRRISYAVFCLKKKIQ